MGNMTPKKESVSQRRWDYFLEIAENLGDKIKQRNYNERRKD